MLAILHLNAWIISQSSSDKMDRQWLLIMLICSCRSIFFHIISEKQSTPYMTTQVMLLDCRTIKQAVLQYILLIYSQSHSLLPKITHNRTKTKILNRKKTAKYSPSFQQLHNGYMSENTRICAYGCLLYVWI